MKDSKDLKLSETIWSDSLTSLQFCALVSLHTKKSRVFLNIGIIIFILLLSMMFFWYGHKAYGILMLAIPAVSLLISACCYMASRNEEANEDGEQGNQISIFPEDNALNRHQNPFADRPPSYRMTWRRSFIKRFKARTESSHQTEMTTIQKPSTPSSPPHFFQNLRQSSVPQQQNGEVESNNESDLTFSEQSDFSKLFGEEGEETARSDEINNKPSIECQKSLPTYEEALKIINSKEDLQA